ncbi:MAG: response regulator [Acidimicrobiia bacterium]
MTIRLLIADDHGIVRDGIRWMLVNEPSIEIVGEAADGAALLRTLEEIEADVVLLDVRMPGMSGLETLDAIVAAHPDVAVLMVSMYDEPELVTAAIERGAHGYLLKNADRDEMIKAIRTVGEGGSFLQGELTATLLKRLAEGPDGTSLPDLTEQERRILALIADGLGNREIADDLGITEPGAKAALQRIFKRLRVKGRSEAVAVALRLGLID